MKVLGPILGGVLLLIVGTVRAADLQKGIAAYLHGDYTTALSELTPLAKQGNAFAQFDLGSMYDEGHGVSRDYVQAAFWYLKAAGQGNAEAQLNLGVLYAKGRGVPQDYGVATTWYRKAADQGIGEAQYNLGLSYVRGQGVPPDNTQAVAWYRKAALQGFAAAQNCLGNMYGMGQGVPQDYGQAVVWYRKAAEQGDSDAQFSLGAFYAMGRGVPRDYVIAYSLINLVAKRDKVIDDGLSRLASRMTPAQLEDSKALTREMRRVGVQEALRSHPTVSAIEPHLTTNTATPAKDGLKAFPIQLKIDQSGFIYWNAILVDEEGLKAQFAVIRQMANQPGVQISIRGDAKDPKIKKALAVVLADAGHYNITHVEVIGRR